jgi:hypothetical protein
MRACLDAGYQPLAASDERAARMFRQLALLSPAEFGAESVAQRFGMGAGPAGRTLERLVDARLLECVRPGRYRMAEPLRRYAAELVAPILPKFEWFDLRSRELLSDRSA